MKNRGGHPKTPSPLIRLRGEIARIEDVEGDKPLTTSHSPGEVHLGLDVKVASGVVDGTIERPGIATGRVGITGAKRDLRQGGQVERVDELVRVRNGRADIKNEVSGRSGRGRDFIHGRIGDDPTSSNLSDSHLVASPKRSDLSGSQPIDVGVTTKRGFLNTKFHGIVVSGLD